jgi:hypothetical protein
MEDQQQIRGYRAAAAAVPPTAAALIRPSPGDRANPSKYIGLDHRQPVRVRPGWTS